mmetsp:Transcript_10474/g.15312  ORF Transcript_10474/g.15312 Transcript_10474/m.15312 type:complete len:272 (+) Transcript_10474:68-883(+)
MYRDRESSRGRPHRYGSSYQHGSRRNERRSYEDDHIDRRRGRPDHRYHERDDLDDHRPRKYNRHHDTPPYSNNRDFSYHRRGDPPPPPPPPPRHRQHTPRDAPPPPPPPPSHRRSSSSSDMEYRRRSGPPQSRLIPRHECPFENILIDAEALMKRKDYATAAHSLEAILREYKEKKKSTFDGDFHVYDLLASCFYRVPNINKTIQYASRALQRNANASHIYCCRACANVKLGHFDEGLRDINKALEKKPQQPLYLQFKAYILHLKSQKIKK